MPWKWLIMRIAAVLLIVFGLAIACRAQDSAAVPPPPPRPLPAAVALPAGPFGPSADVDPRPIPQPAPAALPAVTPAAPAPVVTPTVPIAAPAAPASATATSPGVTMGIPQLADHVQYAHVRYWHFPVRKSTPAAKPAAPADEKVWPTPQAPRKWFGR